MSRERFVAALGLERGAALVALALALVAPASSVRAQPETPTFEPPVRVIPGAPLVVPASYEPRAVAISTSGGSSLGGYEAGYLYYLSEVLKRNPGAASLRVATGASAGAINSVLLALSYCSPPIDRPEDALLYRVWHRPTLTELYRPDEVTATSMLSRGVLWEAVEEVEARFDQGLPTTCDMLLGIPTTRLRPIDVPIPGGRTTVPRVEERFTLRLRGRGEGVPPLLENYVDREESFGISLLPIDGHRAHEVHYLFDLAFASSAFPIAFAPVELAHCVRRLGNDDVSDCTPEVASHALFVDGSVLDNQPLRLAANLLRMGIVPASEERTTATRVRDRPLSTAPFLPDRLLVLNMDPHAYAFDGLEEEQPPISRAALGLGTNFAQDLVSVARSKDVLTLLENHPEVHDSLRVTNVYYPPIASLLGDFFALVDRKLVDFDFVLGMHDARKQLVDATIPTLARELGMETIEAAFPDGASADSMLWREFACMRAVFDGEGDAATACAGDELRSFRATLQLTLDRLYTACAESHLAKIDSHHAQCLSAFRGRRPPTVPGVDAASSWRLPHPEDPTRAAIERLGAYGFWFEDLGLGPDQGDRAVQSIRALLGRASSDFARAQPSWRELLDDGLTIALNTFAYQPRRMVGHVVFSLAPEVGVSLTRPNGPLSFLRAAFALSFEGLQTSAGIHEAYFAIAPQVGLEIEPIPLSNERFQMRLGARFGYVLSSYDHANQSTCPSDPTRQVRCSRAVIDTYLAFSIVEIFRVQLAFAFRPAFGKDEEFVWSILPGFGLQFHSRR